ncbi:hypothetical protein GR157_33305 [Burkholderia sp. 4701]|nr:hypothetical protein [Burkholderia sp. 4701]MXN86950.1 hypothetical protein [Burkholderia sp. 4812]
MAATGVMVEDMMHARTWIAGAKCGLSLRMRVVDCFLLIMFEQLSAAIPNHDDCSSRASRGDYQAWTIS